MAESNDCSQVESVRKRKNESEKERKNESEEGPHVSSLVHG